LERWSSEHRPLAGGMRGLEQSETETRFVLETCLRLVKNGFSEEKEGLPVADVLYPKVAVTESAVTHSAMLSKFTAQGENLEVGLTPGFTKDCGLAEDADPVFATSVLWLHLKRRKVPLIPFELFSRMHDHIKKLKGGTAEDFDLEAFETDEFLDFVEESVTIDDLRGLIMSVDPSRRKNLFLVFEFLHSVTQESNGVDALAVANLVTPILGKPKGTTYMSIRHREEVVLVRIVVRAMLEKLPLLENDFRSDLPRLSLSPLQTRKGNGENSQRSKFSQFSSSIHPDSRLHSGECAHAQQPQEISTSVLSSSSMSSTSSSSSSVSSTSRASNALTYEIMTQLLRNSFDAVMSGSTMWFEFARVHVRDEGVSEKLVHPSPPLHKLAQRVKQTPPSEIPYDTDETERASIQKSASDGHLLEQQRQHEQNDSMKRSQIESRLERAFADAQPQNNNLVDDDDKDRIRMELEMEKKVLKQKLKRFDEDFEKTHGRKPSRVDKEPIRHLYGEYHKVKQRLQRLPASILKRSILVAEKRQLQAKLRDFERKFEQKHGRKIEAATDIEGLEKEYKRYKELKELLGSTVSLGI